MTRFNFFMSKELNAGLETLEQRDGVPKAESIRRAIASHLKEKGIVTEQKEGRKKR